MSGSRSKFLRKKVLEDMKSKHVDMKFFGRIYRTVKRTYTRGGLFGY